jgi:hypothetical protein
MQTLKELLAIVLQSSDVWQEKLLREWPYFVGDLHSRMRLERIVQDTVYVGVYDVRWLHELHCLSSMIMDGINKKLGGPFIKKIIFRNARPKKNIKTGQHIQLNVSHISSLSERELKTLREIKDQELQQALLHYRLKCH